MILVSDGGSTKTHWCLIEKQTRAVRNCITSGINPYYQTKEEIFDLLSKQFRLKIDKNLDKIFFYGAGCGTEDKKKYLQEILKDFFGLEDVFVDSDMYGAALSLCGDNRGVACILGTGSNSAYWDGNNIVYNIPPLGYILGDEGSGANIGRQLISDVFKHQLSDYSIKLFNDEYNLSVSDIIENVYNKPFPNRYLASFSRFIYDNMEQEDLVNIVINSFENFVKRNLLRIKEIYETDVNFTGGIAFYFKEQLNEVLNKYNLRLGEVSRNPMGDLLDYVVDKYIL